MVASSVHFSFRTMLIKPSPPTGSGECYRAMVTNFFLPELDDMNVNDMWVHQDGARCHKSHATLDILHTLSDLSSHVRLFLVRFW